MITQKKMMTCKKGHFVFLPQQQQKYKKNSYFKGIIFYLKIYNDNYNTNTYIYNLLIKLVSKLYKKWQ